MLGGVLSCVGDSASVVPFSGGSNSFVEVFDEYLGTGKTREVMDYPVFDLAALKRCIHRSSAVVPEKLDLFSNTEFLSVRLKGFYYRDWMRIWPTWHRAIESRTPRDAIVVGCSAQFGLCVAFGCDFHKGNSKGGSRRQIGGKTILQLLLPSFPIALFPSIRFVAVL